MIHLIKRSFYLSNMNTWWYSPNVTSNCFQQVAFTWEFHLTQLIRSFTLFHCDLDSNKLTWCLLSTIFTVFKLTVYASFIYKLLKHIPRYVHREGESGAKTYICVRFRGDGVSDFRHFTAYVLFEWPLIISFLK